MRNVLCGSSMATAEFKAWRREPVRAAHVAKQSAGAQSLGGPAWICRHQVVEIRRANLRNRTQQIARRKLAKIPKEPAQMPARALLRGSPGRKRSALAPDRISCNRSLSSRSLRGHWPQTATMQRETRQDGYALHTEILLHSLGAPGNLPPALHPLTPRHPSRFALCFC
jgi:hypothetical protein